MGGEAKSSTGGAPQPTNDEAGGEAEVLTQEELELQLLQELVSDLIAAHDKLPENRDSEDYSRSLTMPDSRLPMGNQLLERLLLFGDPEAIAALKKQLVAARASSQSANGSHNGNGAARKNGSNGV